jgi:hypothetical protein
MEVVSVVNVAWDTRHRPRRDPKRRNRGSRLCGGVELSRPCYLPFPRSTEVLVETEVKIPRPSLNNSVSANMQTALRVSTTYR